MANLSDPVSFRFHMPVEVLFAAGTLDQLGHHSERFGEKAFVVTGKRSARESGALDQALAQLPQAVVFDGVDEDPDTEICERGANLCRDEGCDVVVAIGGGSAMDAAKGVAVLAQNELPCGDLFGAERYGAPPLPVIAVPTTAGTGSEVTPYAVLVDAENHCKRTISGAGLFPRVALLDPALSVTMPPQVTAHTGLDALSQAMEGLVSLKATPLTDTLALEACHLIRRWLPRAAWDGTDIEARSGMLYASMLAGCVIAHTGTTLVHGMGYYFTLEYGLSHGLANGLLLTPLFQFNAEYEPGKVAAIAGALGYPAEPTPSDASGRIGEALYALLGETGVSPAARDAGVGPERLGEFAEDIAKDPYRFRNQVGDVTVEDVKQFFELAQGGRRAD